MAFLRQAHEKIVDVLRSMNCEMLLRSSCFFRGGTAIVLKHGEYRQSLDLDFRCADPDGYRDVRAAWTAPLRIETLSISAV